MAATALTLVAAVPPASAHVCLTATWPDRTVTERHTFDLMAAERYPLTNWSISLLPGSFSARSSVQGYVLHPRRCDALIAAGSSTATIAVSPLVPTTTAWTDASATSRELSNVANHPAFNRVVPADDVGGSSAASIAFRIGWTKVSVLCVNNAYGRSLLEAFSKALTDLGGEMDVISCWEDGATEDDIREKVADYRRRRTAKAVFIAASFLEQPEYIARTAVHVDSLVLMVESCTTAVPLMPGALCAVYAPIADRFAAFKRSLAQADIRPWLPDFAAAGMTDEAALFAAQATNDVFSALAHDGMQHAMHAVYTYPDANQTAHPTIAEYLRSFSLDGLTGTVRLTPEGDRPSARMNVRQAYLGATSNTVQQAVVGEGDADNIQLSSFNATTDRPGQLFWFNGTFSDSFPANTDPIPEAGVPIATVVIIAVVAAVIVGLVAFAIVMRITGGGGKSLANCPLDEAEPFAVLFVGLANEATLNDLYTEASVNEAVSAMAKLVRAAVRDAKCFEAQRVDEGTFMIVAKSAERALDCAARISATVNDVGVRDGPNRALKLCHVRAGQRTLSRNNSRALLLRQGSTIAGSHTTSGNSTSSKYAKSHNNKSRTNKTNASQQRQQQSEDGRDDAMRSVGLKVTSGIAFGFGTIDHDAEHEVLSYRGGILAVAASVTDAGVPGQIVVTERLVDAVIEDDATVDGRFEFYLSSAGAHLNASTGIGGEGSSARHTKRSGSKSNADANTMHTFLPTAQPATATVQLKEAIAQRQQQKSGANEGAGGLDIGAGGGGDVTATGIMSALTRAETGVAPRRCSIAVVYVPEFADPGVADQHVAKHATTMVGIIAAAAKRNRCHVHEVVGSTIFVSANAVGGTVSNPGFRTATFARDVIDGLANSSSSAAAGITVTGADGNVGPQQQQQSGGLAIGLCGGSAPAAGFIHDANVVAGPLADHARLALAAARALELPCVLAVWGTSTHESDVDSHFVTVPVDAASSCTTRTRKRPEGGRTALLCSVEHARDTTGGEWLYSFQQASNTTTADFGDAADGTGAAGTWQAFLDGALPALPASTPPTPRMSPKPAELVASPSAAVDPATNNNTNDDTSGPALLPHQNDETIEVDGEPARPPPASPAAVAAADEDSDPLTRTNTIAATRLSRARREAGSAREYAMLRAQELLGVFAGL